VSVLLCEIVQRDDPGQGQANNHCCRHRTVSEDGLWVSKVARSEANLKRSLEESSLQQLYLHIYCIRAQHSPPVLQQALCPHTPYVTSHSSKVISHRPSLSFSVEPANRLWNGYHYFKSLMYWVMITRVSEGSCLVLMTPLLFVKYLLHLGLQHCALLELFPVQSRQ